MKPFKAMVVVWMCLAVPAGADIILDSGPLSSPFVIGASGWNTAAQKFTLPRNLTNVSIEMFWTRPGNDVIFFNGWEDTRVWLMSAWGPGATAADVLGYVTLPTSSFPTNPIFQVPSLAAGDYALVVAPNRYNWPLPSPAGWMLNLGATPGNTNLGTFDVFQIAGISNVHAVNKAFPPASNFQPETLGVALPLGLRISADAVPEPATLGLLLIGGLAAVRRRRQRR